MMRIQDPTTLVLLDGQVLNAEQASLPASWPAVLRGEGIFETFLVREREPTPLLPRHDARFVHSARLTGFVAKSGDLARAYEALLPHLGPGSWRVRLSLLRGLGDQQHELWTVGPEPKPQQEVVLQISEFRSDPLDPLASAKTISRIGWQVARRRAQEAGAFEAILKTIDGDLAEGTSSNLFLWRQGVLSTPGLDRGILGGVTRASLLEACKMAGISVQERSIAPEELLSAEEVYISNAVIGFVPATRIVGIREDLPGLQGPALPTLRAAHASYLETLQGSSHC